MQYEKCAYLLLARSIVAKNTPKDKRVIVTLMSYFTYILFNQRTRSSCAFSDVGFLSDPVT